jgi:hypothetical protein
VASGSGETRTPNWPKFRPEEVVRVTRLEDEDVRRDRLGSVGTVYLLEPDPDERRWRYWIEFGDEDKKGTYYDDDGEEEFYWDDQLESLGQLQVYDDDGPLRDRWDNPVSRVQLSPWGELSGAEVWMTMHVEAPEEDGELLAERAKAAVSALVPNVEVEVGAKPSEKDDHPDCWNLTILVQSPAPSREIFEQLVAAYDRWDVREDSGWWAEFSWDRQKSDVPEQRFGVAGPGTPTSASSRTATPPATPSLPTEASPLPGP